MVGNDKQYAVLKQQLDSLQQQKQDRVDKLKAAQQKATEHAKCLDDMKQQLADLDTEKC